MHYMEYMYHITHACTSQVLGLPQEDSVLHVEAKSDIITFSTALKNCIH